MSTDIFCTQVVLDPKTSRRIFELAKDQQTELQPEEDDEDEDGPDGKSAAFSQVRMTSMEDEEEEDIGDDVEEEEYSELVCDLDHSSTWAIITSLVL